MESVLTIIHVAACIILVAAILVQSGKGASMGAMFGGGTGSQTLFGGRGPATFFQKFTTVVAMVFLFTSVGLARIAKTAHDTSVFDSATPVLDGSTVPADGAEQIEPATETATETAPESAPESAPAPTTEKK